MANLTNGHERDEKRKMNGALILAVLAILFAWVPVFGILLALAGFIKLCVRITEKHRVRLGVFLVISVLSLALSIGALTWEFFVYSRHNDIATRTGNYVWLWLTNDPNAEAVGEDVKKCWLDWPALTSANADTIDAIDEAAPDAYTTPDDLLVNETAVPQEASLPAEETVPEVLVVTVSPADALETAVPAEDNADNTGNPHGDLFSGANVRNVLNGSAFMDELNQYKP